LKLICISASNISHQSPQSSTSYRICELAINEISKELGVAKGEIIELKNKSIHPCMGCGKCYHSLRCVFNDDFNFIYEKVIEANAVIIVSPHYAPIPAKLAALLEKMEQITFLHWGKDNSYKSEVFGKPAGLISHGGGGEWALKSYKAMVNDTIANALDTIQLKTVPLNEEWETGISLPVKKVAFIEGCIFPHQDYDWDFIRTEISTYAKQIIEKYRCI